MPPTMAMRTLAIAEMTASMAPPMAEKIEPMMVVVWWGGFGWFRGRVLGVGG